jgi:hypothetical protein
MSGRVDELDAAVAMSSPQYSVMGGIAADVARGAGRAHHTI